MRRDLLRFALLSGLVLLGVSPARAQVREAVQEGMPAPAIHAQLLDGGAFDSAKQRGKVIVLNFWASWCKPCREEMPALDAFYRAHRAEGLEVIAISIEGPDDLARVKRVMKDFSFPAALAADTQTEGYGRLSRLPVTFVIDRRGVLRFDGFKFSKILDQHMLDKIVTPLLRNSKDAVVAEADPTQKTESTRQGK